MQYTDEATGNTVRDSRPEPEVTPRARAEGIIRARNDGEIPTRWAAMLNEEFPPEPGTSPTELVFSDIGQGHRGTNTNPPIDLSRLKDHAYWRERKADILHAIQTDTLT